MNWERGKKERKKETYKERQTERKKERKKETKKERKIEIISEYYNIFCDNKIIWIVCWFGKIVNFNFNFNF